MPVDIIEMLWGCTICNEENKGRYKTCQNCGKPRTENAPEWMPGDVSPMAAVKDPALLAKFKAGADWKCRFCNSSQFRADGNCAQCGSAQGESAGKAASTPAVSPPVTVTRKPYSPPFPNNDPDFGHGALYDELKKKAETVPDPFPDTPFETEGNYREPPRKATITPPPVSMASDEDEDVDEPPPKFLRMPRIDPRFIIGFFAVASLGFLLYFIFRTKIVDTTVSAVAWSRVVSVDRYQVYRHDGWDPDNGAFNVHEEGQRIHHYDHVRVGSHVEDYQESYSCGETCTTIKGSCYTTSRTCTSNKNGSATCTGGDRVCNPDTRSCTPKTCTRTAHRTVDDYEDQARYRMWYTWSLWQWGRNRDVPVAGSSVDDVRWPSEEQIRLKSGLGDGEDERIGGRSEHYTVTFSGGGETYSFEPKSDGDFKRFPPASRHRLKVGMAHGVEVLQ